MISFLVIYFLLISFILVINLLSNNNKVPSILNGGLEKINPVFFMSIIVFTTTIELVALNNNYKSDRMPGDLGFDPLKLYIDKDPITKRDLELKELNKYKTIKYINDNTNLQINNLSFTVIKNKKENIIYVFSIANTN